MAEPTDTQGLIDLSADFKAYQERVTSSLVNVTRSAGQISAQDLSFHRSSSERVSRALDTQNAHLLRLTNRLLKAATKDTNIKAPNLKDQDGVEDNWRGIVDVVDDLLEKADASLDEFTGVLRRLSPALQDGAQTPPLQPKATRNANTWAKASMQKPQELFNRKVNNYETAPFKPLLKTKPHALIPLEETAVDANEAPKHPYAYEIEQSQYPQATYENEAPIPFTSPNDTQAIWVDTEEAVRDMLEELKSAREIAIDLEHNDRRSYIGLVCLMQISTREKDWIVDTLKPWRENLQILNEIFADPKILKVFHGSSMDMIWLQRDLGLYIVGLFDTYHASVALEFPGRGLKYLLQRFANFEAQKQYQMADWRVRPLASELIDYARSDTHYLLHIYDHIRNMLLESSTPHQNLVDKVRDASKAEALQVYERPIYDSATGVGPLGWFGLLMQRTVTFGPEQFAVFRAVHQWRDQKAREWDEGLQFVMSNAAIWAIAENIPMHIGGLHGCLRPIPRAVADHSKELIDLIKKARYEGKNGPSIGEVIQQNGLKYGFPNRRWRKEKEEPKSQFSGLGTTLQQLNQTGEIDTPQLPPVRSESTLETSVAVRSGQSNLWGTISTTVAEFSGQASAAIAALQAVLPIPRLSSDSFAESHTQAPPATPTPPPELAQTSSISVTVSQNGDRDDVFTLKELARKRKVEQALESPSTNSAPLIVNGNTKDEALIQSPDANSIESHKQSSQQKKAEKRAKKEQKKAEAQAAAEATVPFDYAAAESFLVTRPEQEGRNGAGVKPMNPFAKAMDTSTGARRSRMGKELAGKSMTFNS